MIEIPTSYEKLTDEEAVALHRLMRDKHGNTKACVELTGLNVMTLKRAKDGLDITPENAAIIREKLLARNAETA